MVARNFAKLNITNSCLLYYYILSRLEQAGKQKQCLYPFSQHTLGTQYSNNFMCVHITYYCANIYKVVQHTNSFVLRKVNLNTYYYVTILCFRNPEIAKLTTGSDTNLDYYIPMVSTIQQCNVIFFLMKNIFQMTIIIVYNAKKNIILIFQDTEPNKTYSFDWWIL